MSSPALQRSASRPQPRSALTGLKIVIGPIPALLLLTGILFAAFYPLSREKYKEVVKELTRRREQKILHEK